MGLGLGGRSRTSLVNADEPKRGEQVRVTQVNRSNRERRCSRRRRSVLEPSDQPKKILLQGPAPLEIALDNNAVKSRVSWSRIYHEL